MVGVLLVKEAGGGWAGGPTPLRQVCVGGFVGVDAVLCSGLCLPASPSTVHRNWRQEMPHATCARACQGTRRACLSIACLSANLSGT